MDSVLAEIYSTVLSGAPFVIAAYALLWLVLCVFVVVLLVRFKRVEKEIDVLEDALEAGADDMKTDENVFEILTDPDAFNDVYAALEGKYTFVSAQVEMVPQNYVTLTDPDDIKKFEKMIELMEDFDDIQNVWHNCDNAG